MVKRSLYIISFLLLITAKSYAINLYISSKGEDTGIGTLEKCQFEIRKLIKQGIKEDINIYFREGKYHLTNTIILGLSDSFPSKYKVTFQAYKNEKPIITSEKKISGWKILKKYPEELPKAARGKVWVTEIPELSTGKWFFRTLYEKGKELPRAKSKPFTPMKEEQDPRLAHRYDDKDRYEIQFPKGALKNWKNLKDVEFYYRRGALPFDWINEKTLTARLKVPATYAMVRRKRAFKKGSYAAVNHIEFLDEPGEWVLDTGEGKLYLWPTMGWPEGNITAPCLTELIRVQGKNVESIKGDKPVKGIIFKGLTFTGCDIDVYTKDEKGLQHDWDMYDADNGLLRFRGAEDCRVINCTFRNSPGEGVRLDLYAKNITIEDNHFHDLLGNGILLCGYGPGKKDVNKNNKIINNYIHHITQRFGIYIVQSGENLIQNNRIHDVQGNGMVLSGVRPRFFNIYDKFKWKGYVIPRNQRENMPTVRWDEVGNPKTWQEIMPFTHARNNIIRENEIHDVCLSGGDANAIYTSAGGTGNIIERNIIYGSSRGDSWAIRSDDDQHNLLVRDNIVIGRFFKLKHSRNEIRNNININGGPKSFIIMSRSPDCKIMNNIFYNSQYRMSKNIYSIYHDDISKTPFVDKNIVWLGDEKLTRAYQSTNKRMGFDKNGVYADPLFNDLMKGDLNLKKISPAFKTGFKGIDPSGIGLKKDPAIIRLKKNMHEIMKTSLEESKKTLF